MANSKHHWTPADDIVIIQHDKTIKELAKNLNRTVNAVQTRRSKLYHRHIDADSSVYKEMKAIEERQDKKDLFKAKILSIMLRESDRYYLDMYDAFADYVEEIIRVAKNNFDVKTVMCDGSNPHNSPLRDALKYWLSFTCLEKLTIRYGDELDFHEDINFSKSVVDDACDYIEEIVRYIKMLTALTQ